MSEFVVRAQNITKDYVLYPTPWARIRDLFGRQASRNKLPVHHAIRGISLEIERGERVGIIGRNGAGKSTLLKLITGVITPTSGIIEVQGETHALLQMGAGFHPELTGRQNINGYLANIGHTGARALEITREIIEFSELEEYIDQPLKIYSTGMAMRLIFSASTAIAPSLFVIDEVLAVGDAYFQQKSFARLQELCEKNQTTLLLVSHDVFSTARLCNRIIWVDEGAIKYDGDPKAALNMYDASIKDQEEKRLRKKASLKLIDKNRGGSIFVEIFSLNKKPISAPLYIDSVRMAIRGHRDNGDVDFSFGAASDNVELVSEGSSWGDVAIVDGNMCRQMFAGSSPYRKVVFSLPILDEGTNSGLLPAVEMTGCRIYGEVAEVLGVNIFYDGRPVATYEVRTVPGSWPCDIRAIDEGVQSHHLQGALGTGVIWVDAVRLVSGSGDDIRVVRSLDPFTVEVDIRATGFCVRETEFQALIAFHKDGTQDVCRLVSRAISIDPQQKMTLKFGNSEYRLGAGEYTLTVMLVKNGYFEEKFQKFYSINENIYCSSNRIIEFKVNQSDYLDQGAGIILRPEVEVSK